jgi:hypothetical protein
MIIVLLLLLLFLMTGGNCAKSPNINNRTPPKGSQFPHTSCITMFTLSKISAEIIEISSIIKNAH